MRSSRQILLRLLPAVIVLITGLCAGSITPAAAQESLTPGTPVQGTLSGNMTTYTISVESGQMLTIGVESDDFDVQVSLVDAFGAELATDDDSGGGTNALLGYVTQTEGVLTVIVSAWSGTGAFTITANVDVPPIVELGQPYQLDILGKTVLYVTFEGRANSVINLFTTNSDQEDLRLTLYGVDGQELVSDDDSGPGTSPYLRRVDLPDGGLYLVKIDSVFDRAITTPASIMIEPTERLYLTSTPQTVTLGDESLNYEVFTFEASAGTTYRIIATSDAGEGLRLQINEPDGSFSPGLSADTGYRVAWDYRAESSGLLQVQLYPGYFGTDAAYSIALEPVK